jgi:hypothetical protein
MISNYKINEATKVVTVTYESKDYTLPPNNQDGVIVALPENDCEGRVLLQIKAEEDAIVYAAQAYARSRALEYPSIADQLDDIYHNGIDAWKATIKTTKDKYPKE